MTEQIVTDANGRKYITTEPLPAKIIDYEAAYYALQKKIGFDRADERNKLAAWMRAQGYATGHGDTMEGLLEELEREVGFKRAELWIKRINEAVLAERKRIADIIRSDKYGIGNMCSQWTSEDVADDILKGQA